MSFPMPTETTMRHLNWPSPSENLTGPTNKRDANIGSMHERRQVDVQQRCPQEGSQFSYVGRTNHEHES